MEHQIRVGPAGWSYKDWEGTVYPPHGSKFDHLAYLASFFDTIEINSPFYRIPPPTHAKSWVRRVAGNPDFKFTTKVFRGFTHETAELAPDDVKAFRNYLDPLDGRRTASARCCCSIRGASRTRRNRARSWSTLFDAFRRLSAGARSAARDVSERGVLRLPRRARRGVGERRSAALSRFGEAGRRDAPVRSPTRACTAATTRSGSRTASRGSATTISTRRKSCSRGSTASRRWRQTKETYVVTNNHFRGQAIVNAGRA